MTHRATSVGPKTRPFSLALQALAACFHLPNKPASTPAMIAATWQPPDGKRPMPDLTLRAHRLHNRNPKAAARYLEKHRILSKGVFSE
jgi:hypothetical protein